ncbi:MAG TPA: hypothetical protein VM282_14500 [Acidimicrobiales bacterium]|nr:hypothetical protein [Acidimicrobiales bacterium]
MRRRFNRLLVAAVTLALVAAACGDDDSGDAADTATTTTATPGPTTTVKPAKIYTDPRGGLYAEFQKTFDRGGDPFSSETEFCTKEAPTEALRQTEPGITATTITLAHIRTKLEELAAFGFDVYVGNTSDMFSTFAKVVNEQCGGVNGRMIDLQNIDVTALGSAAKPVDQARNEACVTATEDKKAPVVMNTSGFQGTGILCIVEDHKAIYISTTNGSQEFLDRSGGRMFGTNLVLDDFNKLLVSEVIRTKIAEGKVVGVVDADTPGQNEATRKNFVEPLEAAGIKVASYSTLGCKGTTNCSDGAKEAVSKLIAANVDFLYPNLNIVSLPGFVKEMVTQGVKPGQVQFINSNFNSQAGDLVSGKVSELGGAEAGALYNGAIFFDPAPTGNYRLTDDPTPFMKMCNETYQQYSTLPDNAGTKFETAGKTFKFKDDFEVSPYGMVGSVCAIFRATLRAIYRAGVNPTTEDITKAMQNLGPIDLTYMSPGSFKPGKAGAPDGVFQLKYNYPCPGGTTNKSNSCVTQTAGPTALKLS